MDHVPQEWINSFVEQMPQRMHDVLDGEGKMTDIERFLLHIVVYNSDYS